MPKAPQILLAFGMYDYHVHAGVVRYAQEHNWNIRAVYAQNHRLPQHWNGDGMLLCNPGALMADFEQLIEKSNIPTILVGGPLSHSNTHQISVDDPTIGKLAAEYFLEKAFQNFMWVGNQPTRYGNKTRLLHFSNRLKESGHTCDVQWWPDSIKSRQKAASRARDIVKTLKTARKPLALLAVSDQVASRVMHACIEAELRIPEDVAILGVDNDELYCDCTPVPLSSIDSRQNHRGYMAAELLDRLTHNKTLPTTQTRLPPAGIIERASTDILASSHPAVTQAITYIRDHFQEPISVADIARHVGMSRDGLCKAFTHSIRKTPGKVLRNRRLEKAKRLLKTTDLKLNAVAIDSGFKDATRLCAIFQHKLGQTPATYRRESKKR